MRRTHLNKCAAHSDTAIDSIALIDSIGSTDSAEGAGTAASGSASDLAAGVLVGRGLVSVSAIPSGLTLGGGPGPHMDMGTTGIPTATSIATLIRDTSRRTIIQIRP